MSAYRNDLQAAWARVHSLEEELEEARVREGALNQQLRSKAHAAEAEQSRLKRLLGNQFEELKAELERGPETASRRPSKKSRRTITILSAFGGALAFGLLAASSILQARPSPAKPVGIKIPADPIVTPGLMAGIPAPGPIADPLEGLTFGATFDPPPEKVSTFNRGDAVAALNLAAKEAGKCWWSGAPRGVRRVTVTYAPTGRVTFVNVEGPSFDTTTVNACVEDKFRNAWVVAFQGSPVTAYKFVFLPSD